MFMCPYIDCVMSERQEESYSENQVREPGEEEQMNYYNEYCRLYLANHVLATQLKELNIEKSELVSKLQKLEVGIVLVRRRPRSCPRGTAGRSTRRRGG